MAALSFARHRFLQPYRRVLNGLSHDFPVRTISESSRRPPDGDQFVGEKRRTEKAGSVHVNCASLERGVTKYYCNRNPRSLELLGMADKPLGYATKNQRMDYYHR